MAGGWFRPITPSRDEPAKLDTGVAHIARMQNYRAGREGQPRRRPGSRRARYGRLPGPGVVGPANQAFLARSVRPVARRAAPATWTPTQLGFPGPGRGGREHD